MQGAGFEPAKALGPQPLPKSNGDVKPWGPKPHAFDHFNTQ
ncbi:MAG: hypothetical protein QXF35_02385 [Candidatus Bilamarchaeaceae archaeon]